tara:strand:- start:1933 stop:2064 length:132 start_codon:yes stop_codon:yes gene_type:complete
MNTEPQNNDEIVWDIENLKKAIADSAADYDLTIEKMKEVDENE